MPITDMALSYDINRNPAPPTVVYPEITTEINPFGFGQSTGPAGMAVITWYNKDTGETWRAPNTSYRPPKGQEGSWTTQQPANWAEISANKPVVEGWGKRPEPDPNDPRNNLGNYTVNPVTGDYTYTGPDPNPPVSGIQWGDPLSGDYVKGPAPSPSPSPTPTSGVVPRQTITTGGARIEDQGPMPAPTATIPQDPRYNLPTYVVPGQGKVALPGMAQGGAVEDHVDIMRSIGIDPKGEVTPEQLDRFNREYNDFLDKRRQKEENWDYEFKEHDAVLARGYSKGGSVTQYDQLFFEKGKEYGVDPMILKGIASVESNFNPKAVGPKTRSGSAQGMMQFIPAMQKPYGITDPFDPEQSVAGAARMMSDLLKRYEGDVGKALEAYNGGPRLVGKSTQTRKYAEKVQRKAQLFAKSGQKPAIEVAGTATQGPSALSRTPQVSQQTPKFNVKPKTGELTASLDDLGNEYKAAIALTYLSEDDSDGLTITERAEQLLADQEEDSTLRGDALSQIFTMEPTETAEADPFDVYAAVQNPQPEQAMPQFNQGGFVFGGTSLPGMPNTYLEPVGQLTPEVKRILEEIEPANKQYEQEVQAYNKQYEDWLARAEAYNKAIDDNTPLPTRPEEFSAPAPKLGYDPQQYQEKLAPLRRAQENVAKYGKQRELALEVVSNPDAYNLAGFGMAEGGAVDKRTALDRVRQFLQAMDVTPLDALYATGRAGAGVAFGLIPSSLNEGEDEQLARYRAMAERERSTPQPPMARSDGSPPYGEDVDMQMFGSTGDRSMDEAKKGFGRSVDAIRRGVQYSPADLLGAPVDVINMILDPIGLGSEKPFMGSEYLIDKGVQAGIYEKPTGEGEETLARFAAGMINPTLGPRAVGKVAEGIENLSRDAMNKGENRMVEKMREMTGNPDLTAKQVYDALLEKQTPGAAAIKPRGGIMDLGEGVRPSTGENVPIPVDKVARAALLSKKDGMGNPLSQDHIDDIINFVEKKYGDYLTKEFGTENDPLRKAIISGRMYKKSEKNPDTGKFENVLKSTKNFSPVTSREMGLYETVDKIQNRLLGLRLLKENPEKFNKLARDKDSPFFNQAQETLEDSLQITRNSADTMYDMLSNIIPVAHLNDKTLGRADDVDFREVVRSFAFHPNIDAAPGSAIALDLKNTYKITDEGIDAAKRIADSFVRSAKLMEDEGARRPLENLLSSMYVSRVYNPNNLSNDAVRKSVDNEIVFKLGESRSNLGSLAPQEIVNTLSLVPRDKLKNMSFGQAMEDGLKRIESTRNFGEVLLNVDAGKSVPKEKLFQFTTPMQQIGSGKNGRQWVKLDDSRQAYIEGKLMRHSVHGYHDDPTYGFGGKEAFDTGAAKIFSLRSMETGRPSLTIEYGHHIKHPNDGDFINQVKGRYNSAPLNDVEEVLKFADQNNLKFPKDKIEFYPRDQAGESLDERILIRWDQLQQAYKNPNFKIAAYRKTNVPSANWDVVSDKTKSEVIITSADDAAFQGKQQIYNVKYAKGGMVDKPLYDRAA